MGLPDFFRTTAGKFNTPVFKALDAEVLRWACKEFHRCCGFGELGDTIAPRALTCIFPPLVHASDHLGSGGIPPLLPHTLQTGRLALDQPDDLRLAGHHSCSTGFEGLFVRMTVGGEQHEGLFFGLAPSLSSIPRM